MYSCQNILYGTGVLEQQWVGSCDKPLGIQLKCKCHRDKTALRFRIFNLLDCYFFFHGDYILNFLFQKEKKFILLIEDDIHFIHAPRRPTKSITSTCWHMCTVLADIHTDINAVPQNQDINRNHRSVTVTMKDGSIRQCRGGIDIQHLLGYFRVELRKYFSSSFLSSLPAEYAQVNFSNIQDSFQNLRY